MNKFFFSTLLLASFYSYSCSDLLDTDMRLLDSSEELNLCEYENNVLLIVMLQVGVVTPINMLHYKIFMRNIKMMDL